MRAKTVASLSSRLGRSSTPYGGEGSCHTDTGDAVSPPSAQLASVRGKGGARRGASTVCNADDCILGTLAARDEEAAVHVRH